jgi:transcription termination/antitermination protein NusG
MPTYELADMVRIKSGPFNNFLGKVEGIHQAKLLLKIAVEILSNTRIALKFSDVEKASRPPMRS